MKERMNISNWFKKKEYVGFDKLTDRCEFLDIMQFQQRARKSFLRGVHK